MNNHFGLIMKLEIMKRNRIIAFYLPQFHPIPENDKWWGRGFTEWTNVGKAKPLYCGHYQPRVPADLGYYDLRCSESREAQAEMAQKYGIEGFCYWHYWFGNGRRLLERPFTEVLESGKPNFPFCLAWANESWRGFWHGVNGREVLIEQQYPSEQDIIDHFYELLPAFKDSRYIKVDNKPLFMIYKPFELPDANRFIDLWRDLAKKNGLKGIHFVGQLYPNATDTVDKVLALGFDAVNTVRIKAYTDHKENILNRLIRKIRHHAFRAPIIHSYKAVSQYFISEQDADENVYPSLIPNWDHTPRTGRNGLVFHNSTPVLFEKHLHDARKILDGKDNKICFLKSWNEWAEGNYVEPDMKYGYQYLEAIKDVLQK